MRRILSSLLPSPAIALVIVLLLVVSGGLAIAATSPGGSVIGACANRKTGALRLAGKCHRNERSIRWNQLGPQGPSGPAGPTGAGGTAGGVGQTGQTGPQGPGATPIVSNVTGPRTPFLIATVGPWTVYASCTVGVSVNILGPGHYYETTISGEPGISTATATHVNNGAMGEGGVTANTAGANQQMSADIQLTSGTMMYELRLQMTETGSGISNPCTVTGSAIPIG